MNVDKRKSEEYKRKLEEYSREYRILKNPNGQYRIQGLYKKPCNFINFFKKCLGFSYNKKNYWADLSFTRYLPGFGHHPFDKFDSCGEAQEQINRMIQERIRRWNYNYEKEHGREWIEVNQN